MLIIYWSAAKEKKRKGKPKRNKLNSNKNRNIRLRGGSKLKAYSGKMTQQEHTKVK